MAVVLLAVFALSGKCQRTLSPQALNAIQLFDSKDFDKAAVQFRKLMNRFPDDPLYAYYYAATLIELNQQTDVAIGLLKNCLNQMPLAEGYYYLGLAYFRQFKWDESRQAFSEAKSLINKSTTKSNEILQAYLNLNNRIALINKPVSLKGSLIATFHRDSLYFQIKQLPQISHFEIQFNQLKYDAYTLGNFTPDAPPLYFSAPGRNGKYDIYMRTIDKNSGKIRIETLNEPINSDYDDILPIFDPVQHMLYFVSNRPSGLGGFDIYKCKLTLNGQPAEPVQLLPFPINSPWNEWAIIPDNNNFSYLISDRSASYPYVSLYQISPFIETQTSTLNASIHNRCFFQNTFAATISTSQATEITNKPSSKIYPSNERFVQIQKALNLQRYVDSLQIIALNLRNQIDALPNNDYRKSLFAQWKNCDNEIKNRQSEVNEIYAKLISSPASSSRITDSTSHSPINQFNIAPQSIYNDENPIPEQLNFPSGVIYTIQLGVFSKKVSPAYFGGIQPIVAEFLNDKKLIKYYAGVFSNFALADSSLQLIKKAGFKEAFIVAYYDNKKIPLNRAQELEKANNK